MQRGFRRIDYLKFAVNQPHDLVQEEYAAEWSVRMGDSVSNWGHTGGTHMYVAAGKLPGQSSYIFEAWGEHADHLAYSLHQRWWRWLRRIDLRTDVPALNDIEMRRAAQYLLMRGVKCKTVYYMDTAPRRKTNQRDVGGIGLVLNSRKSAQHAVIYKRGYEPVAVEYRMQDVMAQELGRQIAEVHGWMEDGMRYDAVIKAMEESAGRFFEKTLGGSPGDLLALADTAAVVSGLHQDALPGLEECIAAEDQWAAMSDEEQTALQDVCWEPTPQGWKNREPDQAP